MRSRRDALDTTANKRSAFAKRDCSDRTHGSFIRRSVSLIMRLGRAMVGYGPVDERDKVQVRWKEVKLVIAALLRGLWRAL